MRAMCAAAAWTSTPIAAPRRSPRTTAGWCASNEKSPLMRAFFCVGESDAHIGQALQDVAQGAGEGRVLALEALDRQVDAVDQAGVGVAGQLLGQFQVDLLHQLE